MTLETEKDSEVVEGYPTIDKIESLTAGSLPCSSICKTIFQQIKQLGETNIEEHRDYVDVDLLRKPWRNQMQDRAELIAKWAKQLKIGKQPEESTKSHSSTLESEILARLSVEVQCTKCRARFWDAERSAPPERLNNDYFERLKDMQSKRAPCSCEVSNGKSVEERVSRCLFEEITEEGHDDKDASDLQPPSTNEILHRVYNVAMPSLSLLSTKYLYRRLFMPFLVVASEPEGELEGEETHPKVADLRRETFIKTVQLLLAQEGLRQDAGETAEWEAGPLAWALSHRGTHWNVTALYMEDNNTTQCRIHILPLWHGGIESPDHSLQLLLIVDYIVDWAREVYHGAIMNSLIKASKIEPNTIIHPIRTSTRFNKTTKSSSKVLKGSQLHLADPLRDHDSKYGVVRDARYVRSLFFALYVTEDNFGTLIGSLPLHERKILVDSILQCLSEAWRVPRAILNNMERIWTSKSRDSDDQYPDDKIFLTVITITAYLTPSWEPTRELGYLAVAESLLDRLLEIASLQRHPGRASAGFPLINSSKEIIFSMLKQCTGQDTLKACIARVCRHSAIRPMMTGHGEGRKPDDWQIAVSETTPEGIRHRLDVVFKPASVSKSRNIVFDLHSKQIVSPSSSLFRISSLVEELPRPGELTDYPKPPSGDDSLWNLPSGLPDFEEKNVVLATAVDSRRAGKGRDELCVFLMDPSPLEAGVPLATLLEAHPDWHVRVTRFHRKLGWGAKDGNLRDFICRDQSMIPKMDEYRKYLQDTTRQGHLPGGATTLEEGKFWAPARDFRNMDVMSREGASFNFMDALDFVELLQRRQRLSSVIWRNPPENAETTVKAELKVDSNGNLIPKKVTMPGTTDSQQMACSQNADDLLAPVAMPDTPVVGEVQMITSGRRFAPGSEEVVSSETEPEEFEAGPSKGKGKRPLDDGLPRDKAAGSSSKRRRLSISDKNSGDALSDAEFDRLMLAGAFS